MMSKENIYLIGFMGSGKSVVAKQLATKLNMNMIDLDSYIEHKTGQSISSIFVTKGEIAFREIEYNYLKELSSNKENTVFALGGGTICNKKAYHLIHLSLSIYLRCSIEVLVDRLWLARDIRPLIKEIQTKTALKRFVRTKLKERVLFYKRAQISLWNKGSLVHVINMIISKLDRH